MGVQKDCYPFIFTNIKGPILVKEEDMDAYIRKHEDDFIGQAEESLPIKSCRRLFELFDIDTDWIGSVPPKYMITGVLWRYSLGLEKSRIVFSYKHDDSMASIKSTTDLFSNP